MICVTNVMICNCLLFDWKGGNIRVLGFPTYHRKQNYHRNEIVGIIYTSLILCPRFAKIDNDLII